LRIGPAGLPMGQISRFDTHAIDAAAAPVLVTGLTASLMRQTSPRAAVSRRRHWPFIASEHAHGARSTEAITKGFSSSPSSRSCKSGDGKTPDRGYRKRKPPRPKPGVDMRASSAGWTRYALNAPGSRMQALITPIPKPGPRKTRGRGSGRHLDLRRRRGEGRASLRRSRRDSSPCSPAAHRLRPQAAADRDLGCPRPHRSF